MATLGHASFYIGLCKEIHLKRFLQNHWIDFNRIWLEASLVKYGIKLWANQGAVPCWGPERGYNRGIWGIWKLFLSQAIFGMKQPWDKDTQVCANKVPGVINGPAPWELSLYTCIYM